jgi:hypothetical protein
MFALFPVAEKKFWDGAISTTILSIVDLQRR